MHGEDKGEGVRELDQVMNGAAEGAWSLWTGSGGGEGLSLQITI